MEEELYIAQEEIVKYKEEDQVCIQTEDKTLLAE